MSDLTEGLFKKCIPFYLLLPLFFTIHVISSKDFHYIVCMYFSINDANVFFSVKHIELLDVRKLPCLAYGDGDIKS